MAVTIDIAGERELEIFLSYFPVTMQNIIKLEVKSSAEKVKNSYRRNARKNFDTGTLDKSIVAETSDGWNSAVIGSNEKQSVFIEFGTEPHFIVPKKAGGMLSFFWPKIGRNISLPFVAHPGTKAMNPLLLAWNEIMEPFTKFTARFIARAAKIK